MKRYKVTTKYVDYYEKEGCIEEDDEGDYVLYNDAAAIEQECIDAYKDRDRWREAVIAERKVIDELEQERDRLRGQRDRLAEIYGSNIWAFEHHNCMSEQCDACDLDALLAEIEKEST